jgi:8-amino-7-oxononanoate synthase
MMFEQELEERTRKGLLREERIIRSCQGPRATLDHGGEVVVLCSNNYLGLAEHPVLREAAHEALERYGLGTGASRLVSGTTALHEELERRIALFKGTDAAILFNSGYAANTGVIPALAGEGDVIFSDGLNHASIIDGCRLSRARTVVYRHCDTGHLDALLREHQGARRKFIVSDGVFSMDGDIVPLPDLVMLAERHEALLMIDDAHAIGVLGCSGRGTVEHFGLAGKVPIQMGTLGKALGSFGAYVAGDRGLISYLRNMARSYVFSTSLPPSLCAASIAALGVVDSEAWRRDRLWMNRTSLVEGLAAMGIVPEGSATPIVPVVVGSAGQAVRAAGRLLQEGIFAPAIRPPSVPEGSSRIRMTVMATHTEEDLDQALSALRALLDEGYLRVRTG